MFPVKEVHLLREPMRFFLLAFALTRLKFFTVFFFVKSLSFSLSFTNAIHYPSYCILLRKWQAREEIRILEELGRLRSRNSKDPDGLDFPIVQMYEHFTFRKHICMTFELLSINLYDLLKLNKFTGLPRDRVRRISFQVLKALCFVSKAGIIHCDLKPENVLLIWPPDKMTSSGVNGSNVSANNSGPKDTGLPFDHQQDFVKLIDFGSSCFQKGPTYPYIQSRFYRAPEVLLRLGYSQPIDIWSFGCLVAELINGRLKLYVNSYV